MNLVATALPCSAKPPEQRRSDQFRGHCVSLLQSTACTATLGPTTHGNPKTGREVMDRNTEKGKLRSEIKCNLCQESGDISSI